MKRRCHLAKLGIGERIITKLISRKENGMLWTGFIWLRGGTIGGLLAAR
jgi:hypothetical protein